MSIKIYRLLESERSSAPIFTQVSKTQRVRIGFPPIWRPHLQYEITDAEGNNRTVRLKLNANSIYQDDQIKNNILANVKFSQRERQAPTFKHGQIITGNKIIQDFLESIPDYEGFTGNRDGDGSKARYRLVDTKKESGDELKLVEKQLEAASYAASLSDSEAKDLLLQLFGSTFDVPSERSDKVLALIQFINDTDENPDKILKIKNGALDKFKVAVGRAVGAGLISFVDVEGQVAMKLNKKWTGVKDVPASYSVEEKESRFIDFLSRPEGSSLFSDIQKDLKKLESSASSNEEDEEEESVVGTGSTEEVVKPKASSGNKPKATGSKAAAGKGK